MARPIAQPEQQVIEDFQALKSMENGEQLFIEYLVRRANRSDSSQPISEWDETMARENYNLFKIKNGFDYTPGAQAASVVAKDFGISEESVRNKALNISAALRSFMKEPKRR